MTQIDLEALAIEHLQSEHFANYLAECISTLYRQQMLDEFNNEFNKALDIAVKDAVLAYLADIGEERIHDLVEQAIRSISKKDLLAKLI